MTEPHQLGTRSRADEEPDLSARIEAILYASSEPLSARQILQVLTDVEEERRGGGEAAPEEDPVPEDGRQDGGRGPEDGSDDGAGALSLAAVRRACDQLASRYLAGDSALQVVEIAGGYRIGTRPLFDPWIRRVRHGSRTTELTSASMETLAVVAYRQPVTRAEIGEIRGVDPGGTLRTLQDAGLVRVEGRKRTVGRPFLYATTDKFLEAFGLRDLEELPAPEEFQELLEG